MTRAARKWWSGGVEIPDGSKFCEMSDFQRDCISRLRISSASSLASSVSLDASLATSSLGSAGSKSVSMATASGRPNRSKRGSDLRNCAPRSSMPLNLPFRTDSAMTSTSFSDAQMLLSQIESPNFPHTEKAVEADLPSQARRTWA